LCVSTNLAALMSAPRRRALRHAVEFRVGGSWRRRCRAQVAIRSAPRGIAGYCCRSCCARAFSAAVRLLRRARRAPLRRSRPHRFVIAFPRLGSTPESRRVRRKALTVSPRTSANCSHPASREGWQRARYGRAVRTWESRVTVRVDPALRPSIERGGHTCSLQGTGTRHSPAPTLNARAEYVSFIPGLHPYEDLHRGGSRWCMWGL